MKAYFLFFLLIPLSLFSQKEDPYAAAKPATDACPTWKKKKSSSKAEYFQYLRSPKAKQQQVIGEQSTSFQQPRYRKPAPVTPAISEEEELIVQAPVKEKPHARKQQQLKMDPLPEAPKQERSQNKSEEKITPIIEKDPEPELALKTEDAEELNPKAEEKAEKKKVSRTASRKKLKLFRGGAKGLFPGRNKAAKCPDF